LQRTTSALTTVVLGAALTASTVLAQQLAAPDDAPRSGSPATKSTAALDSAAAANSQVYGMTVTRSARVLLRNGLDYLSYQQYDRALKFLREAESRVNQQKSLKIKKELLELNDAEVLALKQGIEAAQRGLRKASDAESPYALSDQSRPANGFTPAKPATLIAESKQTKSLNRRSKTAPPTPPSVLGSDGDEQAEPIRLASNETPVSDQPAAAIPSPHLTDNTKAPALAHSESDEPTAVPETPQIPTVSRLPDLTEANGSDRLVTADDQGPVRAESAVSAAPAILPSLVPGPDSARAEQDGTPKLAAQVAEPATATSSLPIAQNPATAGNGAATTAEINQTTQMPGATLTAAPAPAPASAPSVIDLETIPSSATVGNAVQPVDPGAPVHKETEDTVPAPMPSSAQAGSAAKPTTASAPVAASAPDDELPTLPADLSRSAADTRATDTTATQATPAAIPVPAAPADNGLPPLPADLGRSAQASPASVTTPAQAPVEPSAVPVTVNNQPTQPDQTTPAHSADESLRPQPARVEEQPAPTAPEREGSASTLSPASAGTLPQGGPAALAAPTPIDTDMPQHPSSSVSSAPAALVNPPYPTTNPNLESKPTATTATGSETTEDVSSLPPAIPRRMQASSADSFIPDRPIPPSTLKPELQREVERIARRQEEEMRRQAQNPPQAANPPRDTMASDLRTQTQMDISRAPSPAEARPIKAIPVPEDWVALAPRNWAPQRKYWAAAATCHLPLYFQDPVLERYGHSVEQFLGPIGQYLTYPVDDPTQSTQRNQMLQPWFSAGLMGLQIIAWPYNLIMDPPWEAQYDLGYYRPGDNIPTDIYWLPLHGYGPPLRGSNY
jgi:hypothetical protein